METNPEHIKNLQSTEAVAKIKELAESVMTCMFTTCLSGRKLSSRPMSIQKVMEDGSVCFLSDKRSQKNQDIKTDTYVQLFFGDPGKNHYLAVGGTAAESLDKAQIKELWNPILKVWFEGPDDPNLSILTIKPEDGYYWDTKNNRMVQMVKMAYGAITGKESDDSIEGTLGV